MLSTLMIFVLLIIGGFVVTVLARVRSKWQQMTAVSVTGLALLLWMALRTRLPLVTVVSEWPEVASFTRWAWRLDEITWATTGFLLLLLMVTLLAARHSSAIVLILLGFTAVSLATVWADTLAGVMLGWLLVCFLWAFLWWQTVETPTANALMPRLVWLLSPLFFLWLAAAVIPRQITLDSQTWPALATTAVLLAALVKIGVWPVYGWRLVDFVSVATLPLHSFPMICGLSLFARLTMNHDVMMDYSLFLTAFGLLGLLVSLRWLWLQMQLSAQFMMALMLIVASLSLLAGVWAGPTAVLSSMRLVASVAILLIVKQFDGWVRWLAAAVAGVALVGLPLTTGFSGLSALYNAWLSSGRFVLVLVTALMFMLLVMVLWLVLWPLMQSTEAPTYAMPALVALILLVVTLIGNLSWRNVQFVTWLAVLLPIGAGSGLVYLFGIRRPVLTQAQFSQTMIGQALTIHLPVAHIYEAVTQGVQGVTNALHQAILILEGEGGLLWLLAFVVLFLLAI